MKHHLRFYQQNRRLVLLALGGACIGALVFLCVNTAISLDATNDAWIFAGYIDTDLSQHYAGWLFYRASPWSFPLGRALAMDNMAVTFTDSVPIAALFFRLLSPLLPATFQYFGIYSLLCYMLQGAASALLLSLFCAQTAQGTVCVLLGSTVFSLSPIMVDRSFRHTALASHFLILFALYLYFLNRKQERRFRAGWFALVMLAMAIHPYFVPMVLALLFASLVEQGLVMHNARTWGKCVLFLLANIGAGLLTGWVIGAFSTPSGVDTSYGFWSMNLSALINPWVQRFAPWSRVFPQFPVAYGNVDGFNYLGFGILAFGVVALVLKSVELVRANGVKGAAVRVLATVKQSWMLLAVCVCLSAFAVSNVVTFFDKTLFIVPLPKKIIELCSIFRASGRMFWPVNYLLVLSVLIFWAQRSAKLVRWAGVLCLTALLCVQIWDISPALAVKRQLFTQPGVHFGDGNPMKSEAWNAMAGAYARIFSFDTPLQSTHCVALWAAKNGMTTNDPFAARYDAAAHEAQVQTERGALLAGEYDVDTIYLTCRAQEFYPIAIALTKSGADVTCALIDNIWYAVIPNKASVTLPAHSDTFKIYPDLPVTMAEYSDALWTNGVLNSDTRVAIFYDTAAVRAIFTDAATVLCDGAAYEILKVDDSDEGWLMVTLAVDDAAALAGKPLTRGEAAA